MNGDEPGRGSWTCCGGWRALNQSHRTQTAHMGLAQGERGNLEKKESMSERRPLCCRVQTGETNKEDWKPNDNAEEQGRQEVEEASEKCHVARAHSGLVSSLSSVAVHLWYVVKPTLRWRQVCFCICTC